MIHIVWCLLSNTTYFFLEPSVCLTTPHYQDRIKVGDIVEVLEYEGKEKIVGAATHLKAKQLDASAQ